ncbi:hypothetical protein VCHA39P226_240011 [Vibrio chagasii]|nr:hypothetical protein VCHA39P226_240011 [Vibrio chagasii]CAH7352021.1 hypothetical protein VCHA40P240_60213 [Vibrio chagasii]
MTSKPLDSTQATCLYSSMLPKTRVTLSFDTTFIFTPKNKQPY